MKNSASVIPGPIVPAIGFWSPQLDFFQLNWHKTGINGDKEDYHRTGTFNRWQLLFHIFQIVLQRMTTFTSHIYIKYYYKNWQMVCTSYLACYNNDWQLLLSYLFITMMNNNYIISKYLYWNWQLLHHLSIINTKIDNFIAQS